MAKLKGGFGSEPDREPADPQSNPITAAARNAVAELFDELADQWPRLVEDQLKTTDGPKDPRFTTEMVQTMRDQLRRALGLPPFEAKGK